MTNTSFPLAPAGWYAMPDDPPMLARWWDGTAWTREVRGPLPPDPRPIQSLVDGREREGAPLVQAPSTQPPWQRPVPRPSAPMVPGWAAAPWNQPKPRKPLSRGRKALILAAVVVAVLGFGGFVYAVNYLTGNQDTDDLKVGSCVTIAAPILKSNERDVSWTRDDCQTVAGGPVSYQVTQKLKGAASCGESQYIETFLSKDGNKVSVTNTYCLMENLVEGECIYADSSNYEFDVPCTDPRATAKVSKRVEQGSGVTCGARAVALPFNPPGRTYCLTTP